MTPLILASESPRRRRLLHEAGYKFDVFPIKVSEIPDKNLNINEQILDIARRKGQAAWALLRDQRPGPFLIISADTEVIFENSTLGKPQDSQDAFRMLKLLSGHRHEVKTAIHIISHSGDEKSHIETTTELPSNSGYRNNNIENPKRSHFPWMPGN